LVDVRLSALTTAGVAVLALIIAAGSWRSLLRTGNRNLGFVVFGFSVFAIKASWKAIMLARGGPEGGLLELVFSLFDVVAMGSIAWPLIARRRSRARAGGPLDAARRPEDA